MGYLEIFLVFFPLLFLFCYFLRNKNGLPTNWPLVGMLPALLKNRHGIHDFLVELLENSQLTFLFKGPWFTNMYLPSTVDPANVHHIMSKNFANYPKGSKFREIFDVLGDGIFNTDSNLWQYHRKMAQSFLAHPQFLRFLIKKTWEKIERGMIPVLDHASKQGLEIDLQDLFQRFTFDTICSIIIDLDPGSLSINLPNIPPSKALDEIEEAILNRHIVPTCIWKFQRWLGVGQEKKHIKAWEALDAFIYECMSRKREEVSKRSFLEYKVDNEVGIDLITLYMNGMRGNSIDSSNNDKFLRDTFLNFLIAGRDTTSIALSWFFYLLSENPQVLSKVKEELDAVMAKSKDDHEDGDHEIKRHKYSHLSKHFEELYDKLIYLHAALCEALRLYPPVPFQAKIPMEPDILPSGHQLDPRMQIIISMYAMGRMKSIWGEDCYEFKPERWISERGKIKHEPSYKFMAFNAGPRTCAGKNMAFIQMKAVAATIISNYRIQAVPGQTVIPDVSVILRMKHGFKVKVLPA